MHNNHISCCSISVCYQMSMFTLPTTVCGTMLATPLQLVMQSRLLGYMHPWQSSWFRRRLSADRIALCRLLHAMFMAAVSFSALPSPQRDCTRAHVVSESGNHCASLSITP